MLRLQGIRKNYELGGGMKVEALKGVDIRFRKSEFVSILGPSGCGKTTLLNVIGGLDHPTEGTLYIDGRSTKGYGDRDWDNYRNHSIGFVFQSYNLIPHMNVLANVEIAPTISGMPKAERRKRSIEALNKVGLGDQLSKKPNQLSGGQMQRVAIARALVNDPEILLADEPTGALDTATSVQIMEILKSISKDRLIIMVTHNPDLAKEYSSRIISLRDGVVVGDTDPYEVAEYDSAQENSVSPKNLKTEKKRKKQKKASMSFFTALSLSTRNLMTKKTRTILTSFAGSIGIIGIALILSLSNGVQVFIDRVQEDTLSAYPLTLNRQTSDTSAILSAMVEVQGDRASEEFEEDRIYPDDTMGSMLDAMTKVKINDLPAFKKYYEEHREELSGKLNAVTYVYDLSVNVYTRLPGADGKLMRTNPTTIFDYMGEEIQMMMSSMTALSGGNSSLAFYSEMLEGLDGELINDVVRAQYDLVGEESRWPENANEVVLVVNDRNRISNMALYALGFKDPAEIEDVMSSLFNPDKEYDNGIEEGFSYSISDFVGHTFFYVMNADYFYKGEGHYTVDGKDYPIWRDVREDPDYDEESFLKEHGRELKIVGVVRENKNATSSSISTPVAYTAALSREIIDYNNASEIAQQQKQTADYSVFTGVPFEEVEYTPGNAEEFLALLTAQERMELIAMVNTMLQATVTEEQLPEFLEALDDQTFAALVKGFVPSEPSYTKDQAAEFVASLSEQQKTELIAMLTAGGVPVNAENLVLILGMLSDKQFSDIAAMFSNAPPAYGKDQIPEFLEAIGQEGRQTLLQQFKENMTVTEETLAQTLKNVSEQQFSQLVEHYRPANERDSLDNNFSKMGYEDDSRLRAIYLYATDFSSKDDIRDFVGAFNDYADRELGEGHQVEITDFVGALLSGINTVITAISYVLIAFVAISLVVSSIMIAIITYISVLERIKEIGILRSLGASKGNIRNVFNAETLIEGFFSGVLGIAVTLALCLVINPVIHLLTGIDTINAVLPWQAAVLLILISMGLTVLSGLIPASLASKKDPVIALRTE